MALLPVNLKGVQPSTFELLPPGDYLLHIEAAEPVALKSGEGYRLSVKCRVMMGPGQVTDYVNRVVFASYNLDEKNRGFLANLVKAVELESFVDQNGGQIDGDWLINRDFHARLSVKNGFQQVGQERSIHDNGHSQPAQASSVPQQAPMMQPQMAAPPMFNQQAPTPPVQSFTPPMQQSYGPPPTQAAPPSGFQIPAPPPPPGQHR